MREVMQSIVLSEEPTRLQVMHKVYHSQYASVLTEYKDLRILSKSAGHRSGDT